MTCNSVASVTFAFAFALVSVYIVSALRIRRVCSLCQHRSLSLCLPFLIFLLLFLLLFLWLFSRISPTLQATFDTPFLPPSAHPFVCAHVLVDIHIEVSVGYISWIWANECVKIENFALDWNVPCHV